MATASPSALSAVPDRPMAERPEARGSEASDGQFAGLMAQFVQTPSRTSAPLPSGHPRVQKKPVAKPAQGQPAAESTVASTTTDANRRIPGPEHRSVAPKAKAAAPTATADAPAAKAEAPTAKTAVADAGPGQACPGAEDARPTAAVPCDQAPTSGPGPLVLGLLNAPLALAGIPTAPLPSTGATEAYTEATQVTQPSALQKALPQAAPTGPAAIQVTGLSPVLAANQADPKAVESAGPVQPATEATPSDASSTASASLLAKGATPALVQVLQDQAAAGPKAEPIQPQPTTQIQAVLTEPGVHAKAAAKAEPTRPPSDSPDPEALPMTAQGTKTTNAPSNPLVPPPGTLKVLANPATPSDQEAVATFGRTVAAANPAAVDTPATLETLGVKVGPATPPPMPASPDGSALAALSSHARLAEPAPEAAPVPLAPASQPSAPVLQVEGGVRWMLKGGVQEAQLQLHPDSLGQVTIHLRVEGGEVHARLWVTEPGSVQAVQEGRPHLEQSLKEQGLQLGSFDLQQGQRPFQEAPAAPSFRDRPAPEPVLARQEAPVSVPVSILNPHHVELYA